jgi:8-oxo-dGTP diphosphatase
LEWVEKGKLSELDLVEDLPQLLPKILDVDDDQPPMNVHVSYDDHDRIRLRFRGDA